MLGFVEYLARRPVTVCHACSPPIRLHAQSSACATVRSAPLWQGARRAGRFGTRPLSRRNRPASLRVPRPPTPTPASARAGGDRATCVAPPCARGPLHQGGGQPGWRRRVPPSSGSFTANNLSGGCGVFPLRSPNPYRREEAWHAGGSTQEDQRGENQRGHPLRGDHRTE